MNDRRRLPQPSAFTIMEATAAMSLLVVGLVVVAQLLVAVRSQQRQLAYRHLATQEAANLVEQLMSIPSDEVSEQTLAQLELSEHAQRVLPSPEVDVQLQQLEADPWAGPRVTVSVAWQSRTGQLVDPVRLVAWLDPPRGDSR